LYIFWIFFFCFVSLLLFVIAGRNIPRFIPALYS
jgi:hypothetical protein